MHRATRRPGGRADKRTDGQRRKKGTRARTRAGEGCIPSPFAARRFSAMIKSAPGQTRSMRGEKTMCIPSLSLFRFRSVETRHCSRLSIHCGVHCESSLKSQSTLGTTRCYRMTSGRLADNRDRGVSSSFRSLIATLALKIDRSCSTTSCNVTITEFGNARTLVQKFS